MAEVTNLANYDSKSDDADLESSAALGKLSWAWRSWPANLRRAAVLATTVTLFWIALLYFLNMQLHELTQERHTKQVLRQQMVAQLRQSGQEKETIIKNLPLLKDLQAANIFGDEKRLEWVERLRAIEKRWLGVTIRFDISSQKILPPKEGGVNTPSPFAAKASTPAAAGQSLEDKTVKNFGVFSTDMRLTMQLLHEGDIFAVLDDLKQANLGLFRVQDCRFKRPDNGFMFRPEQATLGAPVETICTLVWTSMNAY